MENYRNAYIIDYFIDGTLEDWRSVFDVNVLGLCLCTREAVRMMRETDDAVVIHVNSLAAERVPFVPGFSVYPASKRAIAGLAMTLRHELVGTRIRVTVRYLMNIWNEMVILQNIHRI